MVISQLPSNLLTIKQVAALLNIHPNTLRRWCEEGRIPVVRVTARGDRRFRLEDIQLYLEQLNGQPDPPPARPQTQPELGLF